MFRVLFRKEFLEVIRDRRTLISMVVVPLLAYPVLIGGFSALMARSIKKLQEAEVRVALAQEVVLPGLPDRLQESGFSLMEVQDPQKAVQERLADIGLHIVRDTLPTIRIYYDVTHELSSEAVGRLERVLERFREDLIKERLKEVGLPPRLLTPFHWEEVNVAPPQRATGYFLGLMLGYVAVILMFAGAMYAAIDLTAGEKERRTLEILLSSPASRQTIVLAKLAVVILVAVITALLNLTGFALSFSMGWLVSLSEETKAMLGGIGISPGQIALALSLLLPFAVFVGSLELAVASFARSYKEAQSYLSPLMLVVIFPAMLSFLPGIQFTPLLAAVPVYNVAQSLRVILSGTYPVVPLIVSFASNLAYAALAFGFAMNLFRQESILFRG